MIHRQSFVALVTAVAVLLFAAAAKADIIVLKSGQTLKGKVISETDTEMIVELEEAGIQGNVTIQKSTIQSIQKVNPAEKDYQDKLAALPANDAAALAALGDWCRSHNMENKAVEHYEAALAIQPDLEAAHRALGHVLVNGAWKTAAEAKNAKRELTPEEWQAFEDIYAKAALAYLNGRYEEAVAAYEAALLIQPGSEQGRLDLSRAYFMAGMWDKAHALMTEILPEHPDDAALRRDLARVLLRLHREDDALSTLDTLLEQKPDDFEAWAIQGFIQYTRQEFDAALACYTRCRDILEPAQLEFATDAHLGMGLSLARLKMFEKAYAEFEAILKREPIHLEAIYAYARALKDAGENNRALGWYEKYRKYGGEEAPHAVDAARAIEDLRKSGK